LNGESPLSNRISSAKKGIAGIAIQETAQEHHPTTDAMMNMSNECDFPTNLEQAL